MKKANMKICKIISYPTGGLEFQFFFFMTD